MPVTLRKKGAICASLPFDFNKSLAYLRHAPPPALDLAVTDCSFIKAFRIHGQTLLASVSGSEVTEQPGVEYKLFPGRKISDEKESALVERLCSFLGLDDDLGHFYSLSDSDPYFKPIVQALFGYHPVKFQSPFEAAVWAILSQRNRSTTARNMFRRLVSRFGYKVEHDGVACWAFLEPQDLVLLCYMRFKDRLSFGWRLQ